MANMRGQISLFQEFDLGEFGKALVISLFPLNLITYYMQFHQI